VPDAIFADPRLAPLYDTFDGDRDDLAPYLAIAGELGARTVADIGCGTGALAILLAAHGHTVTAVDPAEASVDIARTKDPGGAVTWIHGDASDLPAARADLAAMTGNVAQVFVTDELWSGTLTAIRAALRPGGWLVFEARRPGRRAWEDWAAARDPLVLDVPGVGRVARRLEVTDVSLPLVSFRFTYRFPDGSEVVSDSTLRFRDRDELDHGLTAHGFRTVDVRDAPDRPGMEFVFLARRDDG